MDGNRGVAVNSASPITLHGITKTLQQADQHIQAMEAAEQQSGLLSVDVTLIDTIMDTSQDRQAVRDAVANPLAGAVAASSRAGIGLSASHHLSRRRSGVYHIRRW